MVNTSTEKRKMKRILSGLTLILKRTRGPSLEERSRMRRSSEIRLLRRRRGTFPPGRPVTEAMESKSPR